jgi:hypothetical protein
MKDVRQARHLRRRSVATLLIAVAATVAILLSVAAVGATTIVQLQSPAYLRSRGAAVEVTVMVVCNTHRPGTVAASSTPATATLTVRLSENVRGGIAGGKGRATSRNGDFRCDDRSHYVTRFVLAQPGSKAFRRGSAFGEATLKVCKPLCQSVSHASTVSIVR